MLHYPQAQDHPFVDVVKVPLPAEQRRPCSVALRVIIPQSEFLPESPMLSPILIRPSTSTNAARPDYTSIISST